MNYKEEITKLIMASYDQGVKDAQQEALVALEKMVALVRADERSVEREALLDLVNAYAKNNTDLKAAILARGNT